MEFDLISLLGKDSSSAEVRDAIKKHGLTDIQKAPPGRVYQGSKKKGIDLLIERNKVLAIQIYVQADKPRAAFTGVLPFGIKTGMSQQQVHRILGKPSQFSEYDSRFMMPKLNAKLIVRYDDAMVAKFLNISFENPGT